MSEKRREAARYLFPESRGHVAYLWQPGWPCEQQIALEWRIYSPETARGRVNRQKRCQKLLTIEPATS